MPRAPAVSEEPAVTPERVAAFAPGRVNLIGEHTDYNDGLALPFAITQGVTVVATALTDRRVEARARDLGEDDGFGLDERPPSQVGWRAFVRGIVAELQAAELPLRGTALDICGTVPRGAGLSSSAALEVALALALLGLSGATVPEAGALARICSKVENDWVHARTGLLDQLASICGRADRALRIDFRSLDIRPVPLQLAGWRLVTLDSGERHANAASGYNERRAECARASELLGLASLRDATPSDLPALPAPLADRARHVIEENARVDAALEALEHDDMTELGRLLDASHASLRDNYAVSTPAVEAAVERLHRAGAAGARVVGGGFGGHVLGLLPPDAPPPAGALEVHPGPGAHQFSVA
jgi:galactokinase